jgi:hypothetical protein
MESVSYSGDQWQEWINSLLRTHCRLQGEVYQGIPDKTQGDGGLEGVSTSGDAYQCYADEGSLSEKDRTKKQKKKVTEDLAKLDDNKDFWTDFLQGSLIKRWFLVVPTLANKEVVAHARREAAKLRKKKLAFLDRAFQAFVVTEDFFEEARKHLEQSGALRIDVVPDAVGAAELSTFTSTKAKFIENTDNKLAQVYGKQGKKQTLAQREKFLKFHLQSSNIRQKLYKKVPDVWERLETFLGQEETTVATESDLDESKANVRLLTVRRKLSADLAANFGSLGRPTVDRIAWGAVASWIGECPLSFRENDNGGT